MTRKIKLYVGDILENIMLMEKIINGLDYGAFIFARIESKIFFSS
jgi:uncharacterized protein with HEPN domain